MIALLYRAPHLHDVLRVGAREYFFVVCEVPGVAEHFADDCDDCGFVLDILNVLQSEHWHVRVEGVEVFLQVLTDVIYECLCWRACLCIHVCVKFNVYTASVCSCMVVCDRVRGMICVEFQNLPIF